VDRALESGVKRIVVPGVDVESSEKAVNLASRFECIFAAIGVHPNDVEKFESQQFYSIEKLIKEPKVVAVGEIGLDFYHHPETQSKQEELLLSMLNLALENQKPVILHSRNSLEVLIDMIRNWKVSLQPILGACPGVFHGFEGNASQGEQLVSLGMMIGIGGPITYKNAQGKQDLVKGLGTYNLVLETDSPFLSPHPYRGQINEPARIPVIAQKIAELLEFPVEEVAKSTSQNAQLLFRWDKNL
jgi:TatD DNase family protein